MKNLRSVFPGIEVERDAGFFSSRIIVGLDEVGRGCLYGPVTVGAVVLPDPECLLLNSSGQDHSHFCSPWNDVRDSKLLSPVERQRLSPEIQARAKAWAVASSTVEEIERFNILNAVYLAFVRAVADIENQIGRHVDTLLIDGNRAPPGFKGRDVRTLVKGDLRVLSIASASVIAKVHRDALMEQEDTLFPQYGFSSHKGYATVQHRNALIQHGPLPGHRTKFIQTLLSKNGDGGPYKKRALQKTPKSYSGKT